MFTVKYFIANLSSILSHFPSKLHALMCLFVVSLRVSLHTENAWASVRIIKGNET